MRECFCLSLPSGVDIRNYSYPHDLLYNDEITTEFQALGFCIFWRYKKGRLKYLRSYSNLSKYNNSYLTKESYFLCHNNIENSNTVLPFLNYEQKLDLSIYLPYNEEMVTHILYFVVQ